MLVQGTSIPLRYLQSRSCTSCHAMLACEQASGRAGWGEGTFLSLSSLFFPQTESLFTGYAMLANSFKIVESHLPNPHCYADDTQLYIAFRPGDDLKESAAITAIVIMYC